MGIWQAMWRHLSREKQLTYEAYAHIKTLKNV